MFDVPAARPRRGLAIASLVLGVLSLPTFGVLCVGAMGSVALGVAALVKARREPAEYGGSGMAVAGVLLSVASIVVTPFIAGIAAGIAVPLYQRAQVTANETATLADVRTLIAAEQAYRDRHGTFVLPECLSAPEVCLGGEPRLPLLPKDFVETGTHRGYNRMFNPSYPPAPQPSGTSPMNVAAFVYVAVPVVPHKTGVRAFCADGTGRVCYLIGPIPGEIADVCPTACVTLPPS